jgi:2TM domain
MPTQQTANGKAPVVGTDVPSEDELQLRDVAVKQLERKRRFRMWNVWIIYPVLGLGLIFGIDTWNTFGRKPITEREIRREMDRLRGDR